MNIPFLRRPAWAASTLVLAALCATAASPVGNAERGPLRRAAAPAAAETEARVIVKYKADAGLMRALAAGTSALRPQHAQTLSTRLGLSLTDGREIGSHAQVLKARGMSSLELVDRLMTQSDVEYAVVDGRKRVQAAPNDPLYSANQTTATPVVGQWYLRAPTGATIVNASSVVASINAPAAWDVTTGSASVVVAVLDTGIRKDHPDFGGLPGTAGSKLLAGYDFIHDAATAGDGSVADADASDAGDYVTSADVGVVPGCTSADVGNSSWHGTQTAGLIGAATNNGTGMASVGRDVMLLPLRVLGKCGGYDSDIQAAMLWAGGLSSTPSVNPNPAKVLNMSLGSAGVCNTMYADIVRQLNAAGVVVVAAAGNDGLAVGTPANCPGVIAVAGVRHAGTKVGYSDLGPEIAIAAPAGNCVNASGACLYPLLTTTNKGATTPIAGAAGASYTDGGADPSLGTSFSSPLVAGTVGLMFSANPGLTPAQVLTALKSSARAFPQSGAGTGVSACTAPTATAQTNECYCTTSTCGSGLLDAGAAVAAVATVTANIALASTAVVAGSAVTLDGSGSRASASTASIAAYQWSITSGGGIASFTSAVNAATATLQTTAAGSVVVSLTVTDSVGRQGTGSVTLAVSDGAVVTPTPTPTPNPTPTSSSGGGGGGGGAMELGWLLGWLASVIGVWFVTPRRARAKPEPADPEQRRPR